MAETRARQNAEALSVSRLRTPKEHIAKIKELRKARFEHEKEWKLNYSFYKGNQYVFYPKNSTALASLSTEESQMPRGRVRLVSNQVMPGVRSLVSKLTKTKPVIHASPSKATEKASRGAQIAERLEEHLWRKLNLTYKRSEAWTWAQIAGQGWWKVGWDFNSGTSMTYLLGPDGQPIVSDKLADLFRDSMLQQGIEPIERAVSMGEVRVDVLSPFDVVVDPSPSDYVEAQYAYCIHRLDPDEVFNRWGVRLEPDAVATDYDVALPNDGMDDAMPKNLCTVYVGYIRKSRGVPKGKYIVFTENLDNFLYAGDWPYPFDELPLVKFPGIQVPGCVYDRAVVSDARPIQKELNKTLSQIIEFKNLNISPQFIAPMGSMQRNRLSNEGGVVWYYNPVSVGGGTGKPEPINLGVLPPYTLELLDKIAFRIREIFQITEVTEGTLPPNLEAGVAIDLLQEVAIDQLEPQIQAGEIALARAGTLMLAFAQKYYDEPRVMKLYGSGPAHTKAFKGSDIRDVDIFVEAGSGIPRSRAGRMMRVERMIEQQLIRPDQAWKYYDMADMKTLAARFAQDEEKAYRENDMLLRGTPLNPVAIQVTISAIQQTGVNPTTQMPISSMEEAQALIMDAALEPSPSDNHVVEMDIHRISMNTEEFLSYPVEAQQRYYAHFEKHMQALMAQQTDTAPIRVSYQIKGTAGPTASAEILNKAGVPVSPETMSELPLLTWVTDSLDKVDMDEAGNDPYTALDAQLGSMQNMLKISQEVNRAREIDAKARLAEKRAKLASQRANGGS